MAALRRAARTAIVSFAGFAIGQWAAGEIQVAVFATLTGLVLLGIADFGGTLRGRPGAIAHVLEGTADRAASRLRGRRARPAPLDGLAQPGKPGPPPGYPENSLEGWIDDLARQLTPDRVSGDGAVIGPEDAGG